MYPPSILIMGDDSPKLLELKQWLENNKCQVCQAEGTSCALATACQHYFDLIVFNIESFSRDGLELCQKLKTEPELSQIPVVVLLPCPYATEAIRSLKRDKVYCLAKSPQSLRAPHPEAGLWQIIQNIQYMAYRYA
jgi:response regulator RpfG family c-di-GMP phosphodiesterase